jgi:hypothetical protein
MREESATHDLKCHTVYFEKVVEWDVRKRKTVEVRKNDRGYQVGDVLILNDWNPDKGEPTGRFAQVLVTHIVGTPWMENDMVAMSILLQDFRVNYPHKEVLATESDPKDKQHAAKPE